MALLFSWSMFAQVDITEDAYRCDFSDVTGWTTDAPQNNVNWDIDEVLYEDDFCAYTTVANVAIYSPTIQIAPEDITSGSLRFYQIVVPETQGASVSATMQLMVVVNGNPTLHTLNAISSSDGWRAMTVNFNQLQELSALTSSATVCFGWVSKELSSGGYLILDDVTIRKRSDAYFVTFIPEDENEDSFDLVTEPGGYLTFPTATRFSVPSGKTFVSWDEYVSSNGNLEYNNISISERGYYQLDHDAFFAQYCHTTSELRPYTITYVANGGSGTIAPSIAYYNFQPHVTLACTYNPPAGKQFKSWNTDVNGIGITVNPGEVISIDQENELSEGITLYAIWEDATAEEEVFTISFNANGGQGTMAPITISQDDPYLNVHNISCTFTRAGYQFAGWATTPNSYPLSGEITVQGDMTLYAIWVEDQNPQAEVFTISFNANGGQGSMAPITVSQDDPYLNVHNISCTFTRAGYQFAGWATTPNSYPLSGEITVQGDMTLYAIWVEDQNPQAEVFTISFNANGGQGSMAPITVSQDDPYLNVHNISCTFTRTGYRFVGWAVSPNSYPLSGEITVQGNMTLYAIWEESNEPETPNVWTVRFDANGGQGTMGPIYFYIANGDNWFSPTSQNCLFTRDGYRFIGWSQTPDGNVITSQVNITRDMTFYAIWEKITEPGPTAINDINNANISIYPNPAQSFVRVNGVTISSLELLDLTGRIIMTSEDNTINLNGINNGVYMLRINAAEGTAVRKIVKR